MYRKSNYYYKLYTLELWYKMQSLSWKQACYFILLQTVEAVLASNTFAHHCTKPQQSLQKNCSQSATGLWGFLPELNLAGITRLTALAEVSHPAVVSKTTDRDGSRALAALGTLVDFVMFVQRRARFATLIEMWRANKEWIKRRW